MKSKKEERKKLFLIDGSSFIFRAFFAIPRLTTSKGIPVNAVYGFANMFLKVIEKYKPDYIACVFDTKEKSFRNEQYVDYKANRGAPPDDLVPQFDYIFECVDVLGIRRLAEPGFEADDVIATLARRYKDCDVTIVSSDKDLMQIVDDRVSLLDTMKDARFGPAEVKAKLGVEPKFVPDYLGLIGDTSDNIPGVPSVGPKTASDLIGNYGDLDQIFKSIPKMKPSKKREILASHEKEARLSKKLATVCFDVDVRLHADQDGKNKDGQELTLDHLKAPVHVTHAFLDFLKKMEFASLVKKYESLTGESTSESFTHISVAAKPKVSLVTTEKEWKKALEALGSQPILAFDTETAGDKVRDIEMVGMSLCGDGKNAYYIPVRHCGDGADCQIEVSQLIEDFSKLCKNKKILAQNLKYDYRVLLKEGLKLEGQFFDTMIAHYLVEPEEKHGLDFLSQRYLNSTIGDFKEVLGKRPNFAHVPVGQAAEYGAMDAWATRNLYDRLLPELKRLELESLFNEIEMPIVTVLAHMEWDGVCIDPKVMSTLSEEYSSELKTIEEEVFSVVGKNFNLNSPKQLSEVLFGELGLPVIQKTKTGFSTDVSVLEKLAGLHPVPALIVRYRELSKLKSTYVDVLPELVEADGRVHANFNQAITATGRLSSSNPNLQNIPIKTESGRKIRKGFVAAPGNVLVGADYSQIELRLVAHLSGDKALIKAFKEKQDVHRATAAEIFNVSPNSVTDRQRGAAKAINFGLIYGKTAFGLAQELKISRTEAQEYIDLYFERYKGVKAFMDQCMKDAHEHGYAKTLFGRRRPIKDLHSKNIAVRNNAQRMALNTPVQGTAADIMKLAMIKVYQKCTESGAKLVLQVHDELVLDVPKEQTEEAKAFLKSEMENVVALDVSLEAVVGSADNWMDV